MSWCICRAHRITAWRTTRWALSGLRTGSAIRRPAAVTAVIWCAAAEATTLTQSEWWSDATANTTGAATSPARSAIRLWRNTSANELKDNWTFQDISFLIYSAWVWSVNYSDTDLPKHGLLLSYAYLLSRRGLFLGFIKLDVIFVFFIFFYCTTIEHPVYRPQEGFCFYASFLKKYKIIRALIQILQFYFLTQYTERYIWSVLMLGVHF